MKIQNLISKVLAKAAPMSPAEHEDLEINMGRWFGRKMDEIKRKKMVEPIPEPLAFWEKGLDLADEWYFRAFFAMAYIFIVRWVQDYINPSDPDEDILDER